MKNKRILPILIPATALATLFLPRAGAGWHGLIYFFKPLTTGLILLLALSPGSAAGHPCRRPVAVGLLFSLTGDILLMLPRQIFIGGLAAFFLAHLCYLRAFTRDVPFLPRRSPLLLLMPALAVLRLIWPGVPLALRLPVLLYLAVLSALAVQCCGRALTLRNRSGRLAAAGALLFFCSDALLAVNRFAMPLPSAGLWILGTYYPAQWLLAAAVQSDQPAAGQ
ncbi:MAG TPA: lysoplasmalogenase [bacterium]|nr:lysoplasmalogenase [bacterium]HPR87941.1 lysoplasmalogenase [bacterium]